MCGMASIFFFQGLSSSGINSIHLLNDGTFTLEWVDCEAIVLKVL
jgi:hypothetical protein